MARIGYAQDADLAVPVVVVLVGEVDLVRRLVGRDFQVARDARRPRMSNGLAAASRLLPRSRPDADGSCAPSRDEVA
jgi:hypothetical protein